MTVTLKRLDHVNLRTADLDRMVAWYGRVLDMHPGPRPDFAFPGAWPYADGHRRDITLRPELTVSGKQYVAQIIEMWSEDAAWPMWVYPSDDKFIASDDYFTFAAYEQAQLDHAVCYVLGTPDDEGVGAGGTFPQEKVVPAN